MLQKAPSLAELISRLRAEDAPYFVYRGQQQDFEGPLVPSLYRGELCTNPLEQLDSLSRLREQGRVFHEFVKLPGIHTDFQKVQRLAVAEYTRHLFGFPLSQLLLQQYGINSEGLDVTRDLDVAATFASLPEGTVSNDLGVIFRFRTATTEFTLDKMLSSDFYNCPWFLDARSILSVIKTCETWGEAFQSFTDYKAEYAFRCLAGFSRKRPLDILKIPTETRTKSRIACQKAGLLFPDIILSDWYRTLRRKPPNDKSKKEGVNAVEDLRCREGAEIFYFQHNPDERISLNVNPKQLFPQQDSFLILLDAFLNEEEGIGQYQFHTEKWVVANRQGSHLLK